MADESYEGWKNYPTWAVNLWLSNDEALYHEALAKAEYAATYADGHPNVTSGIWTEEECRRFVLADDLKQWVTDDLPIQVDNGQGGTEYAEGLIGLHADLLGYALSCVEWEEIADSWIQSAAEVNA